MEQATETISGPGRTTLNYESEHPVGGVAIQSTAVGSGPITLINNTITDNTVLQLPSQIISPLDGGSQVAYASTSTVDFYNNLIGTSGAEAPIACFNSPSSITISGRRKALEPLCEEIKAAGHFARMLQVDLAYHSPLMGAIGDEYGKLLREDQRFKPVAEDKRTSNLTLYSSVTESKQATPTDSPKESAAAISPINDIDQMYLERRRQRKVRERYAGDR